MVGYLPGSSRYGQIDRAPPGQEPSQRATDVSVLSRTIHPSVLYPDVDQAKVLVALTFSAVVTGCESPLGPEEDKGYSGELAVEGFVTASSDGPVYRPFIPTFSMVPTFVEGSSVPRFPSPSQQHRL